MAYSRSPYPKKGTNLKSTGCNQLKKVLTKKTTENSSKNHTYIVMRDITLSVRMEIIFIQYFFYNIFPMVYFGNLIFLYKGPSF